MVQRRNDKIRKEVEERELAAAMELIEAKFGGKKPKKILDGSFSQQELLAIAVKAQVKERQEMEKKLEKSAKQMDYLERAKREEEAPLIEAAYQQRLVEEKILHEREQQVEVEQSRQRHDGDLQQKNRLARMLDSKVTFQERVVNRREVEYARLRQERAEHIHQIRLERKQDREAKRKMIYYMKKEEERLHKLCQEEAARRQEEEERKKKEAAERQAKLDEMAAKQRQRELELEEKLRLEKQQALASDVLARPSATVARPQPEAARADNAAAPPGPAPGKYVPRHLRSAQAASPVQPPTSETDFWGKRDDQTSGDKWCSDCSYGSKPSWSRS